MDDEAEAQTYDPKRKVGVQHGLTFIVKLCAVIIGVVSLAVLALYCAQQMEALEVRLPQPLEAGHVPARRASVDQSPRPAPVDRYPTVSTPEFVYGGTWGPTKQAAVLLDDEASGTLVRSVHATTVLHVSGGGVLMAWFGGQQEGMGDVAIWVARRDPVKGWSKPYVAAKLNRNWKYNGKSLKKSQKNSAAARAGLEPHWNPVLWCADSGADGAGAGPCAGEVVLYFKIGWRISLWETYETRSHDQGATWGEPRPLVKGDQGGRGPVKNKPILLASGAWAAPASTELGSWEAFVDYSRDAGATWDKGPPIRPRDSKWGVIQPTLWESEPGQLHMMMRAKYAQRDKQASVQTAVWRADSKNGGRTWGVPYPTRLKNNNSGLDVAKMPRSGTLVLAHNPTHAYNRRTPLQLSISDDNGATWRLGWSPEVEPGLFMGVGNTHEFSYPAVVPWPVADGGEEGFSLSYTWHRQRVVYVSMSMAELRAKATPI